MKRSKRRTGGRGAAPGSRERSDMQSASSKQPASTQSKGAAEALSKHPKSEAEILRQSATEKLARLNENVNPYDGSALRFRYQVAPRKRVPAELHGVRAELVSGAQVVPELVGGEGKLTALVKRGLVLRAAGMHGGRSPV